MKKSTLFSNGTSFADSFYCCCEGLQRNFKFLLVLVLFMASFSQGVSAQGTLVPSCNLIGPLEACAVQDPNDTSGDIIINIEVARSGAPNLLNPTTNLNFVYSFPSNSSGAFIRSYGNVVYNPVTNRTTQTLVVYPGNNTPEFNLQLNATNSSSTPNTICECSKSVSVSRVAATSSYLPIACSGQTTTLTAVGQYSDIEQYTYTLLPSGPSNTTGVFTGLTGSVAGTTYIVNVESAEGCITTTQQTIYEPAYNPVVLNCPQPGTISACQSPEAINLAFNNWLASFSYTGGTRPVLTRQPSQPVLPALCGGQTTVTWTVTDECGQPQNCTSTFTITPAPAVVVNGPQNSTASACSYADQAAANSAFAAWLAQFTATGGCNPTGSYGQPQAPSFCGGSTEVTFNVSDRCYQGSSITRTFTITPAPAVVVVASPNSTTNACSYADQAAADAAYNAWLDGFTVSGGCAPVGAFTSEQTAPSYCGGTRTVTYVVTDKCYQTTTHTATFTIAPAPEVVVTTSQNTTASACSYADQAAVNAAFAAWLRGFSVRGGCAASGSFGEGQPTAPLACGGATTVTYTVTDKCYQTTTHTATFTVTPAPAVVVNVSQNSTTSACAYADQSEADAAYNAWLAGFNVSGGCAPSGNFTTEQTAPSACGGTRTVTYVVTDKCYQTTTHTATFTITPAPAVSITTSDSTSASACSFADQAAVNAAYAAWLRGFTVSGGCFASGSFGEGQPSAPSACGGSATVTYTVTDKCYETTRYVRTFTVTPAPAVVVSTSPNSTTNACAYADQDAADAAYNAWLDGFTVSGGCAPVGAFTSEQTAPSYCGGTRTVTYVVTDKCYQTTTHTATFTITPAPAVVVTSSENTTASACSYADQAAVNAAFAAWLRGFTVSGGCAPSGSFGEGQPTAPLACGGTRTVTYTVTDKCYETTTRTATFTITPAPAVVVVASENSTTSACTYADQAAADAAYNAWLDGFTVSGGCAPVGAFTSEQTAPSYCGGTRTVTYVVTDKCYQTTTHTATFTITPAPAVVVTSSENTTASACSYADQAAVNAAFAAWLRGFTVSGGCAPSGSFGEGQPTAPLACGGSRTVTYTVTDKCYETTTYTATFTITPAPAVVVVASENSTTAACSYADQAAADAAYNAWLGGFTVSGGCAPVGGFTSEQTAPPYCGGTRTVTYVVADKCYQTTSHTATFTITPAPAVVVTASPDSTTNASSYADQAAADAAYYAWLDGFTVSGGCAPSGNFTSEQTPPPYCGGTRTVTYVVTDKCYETTTHTATFTIVPSSPVVVDGPASTSTSACAYTDQAAANAAFATWLAQFTYSGGIAPSGSFGEGQPTAPLACGGETTVTYTVTDRCHEPIVIVRTFTITAPPAIVPNAPQSTSSSACSYADQAAADAAFSAWLAQFSVTGGCAPSGVLSVVGSTSGTPTAPSFCGGSVSVTYTISDKCIENASITRTFLITPAPAVVVATSANTTTAACEYADQAAADAAYNAWLAGFTVSGGCQAVGGFTNEQTAPSACGGTRTVTYVVTDKCYQTTTHTATFTITPAPAVVVNVPQNISGSACRFGDQAAVNSAFAAWLNEFTVTGGCSASGSFGEGQPTAPSACGGTRTVTYTVTDKCYETTTHTATFTVTPAPAVVVTTSENSTTSACSYADQDAADAAYASFLAGFSVSGGCNPSGNFTTEQTAPAYCGGTRTVTYVVTDKCYETTTHTATFTITPAPAISVASAQDSTTSACSYADQAAANAAFAGWLAGFTYAGGCQPSASFGEGQPTAPNFCGGSRTVTYTVSDKCYETTTRTATFTITPAPAVVVASPENTSASACSYADQAAVNAAFNAWLAGFNVTGGCNPAVSFGEGQPTAPLACGGSTTVTYSVADKCYEPTSVTKTFTITPAPAVTVTTSENATTAACSYADQAAADSAYNAWIAGFTATGGCQAVGAFTNEQTAPAYCGGTRTVTFVVTDKCYQTTSYTRTFTITPAPAVTVTSAQNSTTGACTYANQAAANAAFATWLAGFTVSGGCAPSGSFGESQPTAPAYCGGTTTVTYTVTDKCFQTTTRTATFTITPAPAVVFNCGTDVTIPACSTQAQVNSAYAAFKNSVTASGGCVVGTLTNNAPANAPSACGGSVTVTWTYNVNNACGQPNDCQGQFTTFTQGGYGTNCNGNNPGCYRDAHFNAAFPNGLVIGCGVNKLTFTSSSAIASYLPAGGGSALLSGNVVNPVGSRGVLSSQLIALTLSVGFDLADSNFSASSTSLGSLTIKSGTFAGMSVANFLQLANSIIGGCSSQYTLAQINEAATAINENFDNGTVDNHFLNCGGEQTSNNSVQTCTKTFTVAAPAPVVLTCGNNVTLPACSTQAQLNAAWTAFLNSATATGGCNGVLTRTSCSAPSLCGGYVDVTWTYTVASCGQQSGCGNSNSVSCTKRFTVAAPAPVVINAGNNVTLPACSTQAELNAAWTAFLNSTTATGGCGGVLTRTQCSAPSLCGGYVDVTWTYTVASCGPQSGCGNTNSQSVTRRFKVNAPSQVVFNCGSNVTLTGCKTQAQVNAAYASFLASTTASGGCGGVLTNNAPANAPSACTGGYVDVTWTYTVASCGQQSGCGNTNTMTCTKRFTVPTVAPVVFNCGNNVTVPACSTQTQLNAAWNSFLASTTASGGCNGVLTRTQCVAPPLCGGSVDVTWTYTTAGCDGQNAVRTCTKTFTVAAPSQVAFNCGTNVTVPACSTQAQVTAAWNSFLASTTATGGCNGVLTRTQVSAPSTCGGSVNVTWTYTVSTCGQQSGCGNTNSVSCTRTFTVATPPAATLNCGNNVTVPACSTQAQVTAAWNAFLASTTVSGGCSTGTLTNNAPTVAPGTCGGYVDVTWTYRTNNNCGTQVSCGGQSSSNGTITCTKRFTVAAPTNVTVSSGSNVTVPACSTQAQVTAAWNSFLNSITVSGGCTTGTLTNNAPTVAPSTCGGYTDVTWTYRTNNNCGVSVSCNGQSSSNGTITVTRRFTVAAPTNVTVSSGSNVTVPACSTQAQVTAAWNSFLNSITVSGGCTTGTLTNNAPTVAPSTCGGYTDVTWTYRTNNNCGISVSCNGQSSSNGTITVTRRFTVAAPAAVTINAASNVTIQSCKTQAQVNSAWNSFLASTTVSGGCSTGTLTHNAPTVAPSACGGYVDVTWTYRSNNTCGQTITCNGQTSNASTYTVTRRFTVQSGGEVEVAGPSNVTYANTSFTSQAGVNNAFNSWLCQFRTIRSGCGACAVFSGDNRCAPSWSNGGTVRVTYSISGNCNSDTVTATFTITRNGNVCRDIVTKSNDATVTAQPMDVAFAVKAYPNPFTETFNLDVSSSAEEKVGVAIYDMAGKLIEQRQADMNEISAGLQIGDRYASGVYNVIVTQGEVVKTLRVIKR